MFQAINSKIKDFSNNTVLVGTAAVSFGILVGSFFSYFIQFFLGRSLEINDYGTFNALLAFFNVISVPSAVISLSLIKIVSEIKANNDFKLLTSLFWKITGFMLFIGLVLLVVVNINKDFIAAYFKISESSYILLIGACILINFVLMVPAAYLQGLLRFKAYGIFNAASGLIRFAITVALVMLGYKLNGALASIFLSEVIALGLSILLLRKNLRRYEKLDINPFIKKMLLFTAPVLFVNLSMMALNNLDMVLAKKFLEESVVGYYASVVTVGKVLLFGAGTVSVIMFPQISELVTKKVNCIPAFKKLLVIQLALIIAGIGFFTLFSKFIVLFMFGERFLPAVPYVPKFSIFMGLYVLINFLTMFFLAIDFKRIIIYQVPAVIGQFILLNIYNKSIDEIINVNIFVSTCLLLALAGQLMKSKKLFLYE